MSLARWFPPEYLDDHEETSVANRLSTSSDIFMFGMAVLEVGRPAARLSRLSILQSADLSFERQIVTSQKPFAHIKRDRAVLLARYRGELPQKPMGINEGLWDILQCCWETEPGNRPTIRGVIRVLNSLINCSTGQ